MIALKHKILFFALVLYSVPAMAARSGYPFEAVCLHPGAGGQVVKGSTGWGGLTPPGDKNLGLVAVACAQNQTCTDGKCVVCERRGGKIIEKYCLSVAAIGPQGQSGGASKSSKSKAGKPNTKNTSCPIWSPHCHTDSVHSK